MRIEFSFLNILMTEQITAAYNHQSSSSFHTYRDLQPPVMQKAEDRHSLPVPSIELVLLVLLFFSFVCVAIVVALWR